jgi:ATP-binding cassette subfamily B protein
MEESPDETKFLMEELPIKYRVSFEEMALPDEEIRLAVSTDVSMKGEFREEWLVVTGRRILILGKDRKDDLGLTFQDISSVSVHQFYGNGVLRISTGEGFMDVMRFSRTLSGKFNEAAQMIEQIIRGETQKKGTPSKKNLEETKRCPKCGRPLPGSSNVCPACIDKRKVASRLFGYLRPYWKEALITFLLTLVITGLNLAPPYLTKTIVDEVIMKKDFVLLRWVVLAILAVNLASVAASAARIYLMNWLGQKVIFDLRTQLYRQLQRLSISFYDKRQTGAIMSRITNDSNHLQSFIVNGLQNIIVQVLTLVLIGIILFTMDWKLALIALMPTPIVLLGTMTFSKKIRKAYHKIWRRYASFNATLADAIPGVRVIKAFVQERREVDRFVTRSQDLVTANLDASKLTSTFFPFIGFIMTIGTIVVWAYGGYHVIIDDPAHPRLTLGVLMAFISYMWHFYGPVQALSHLSATVQEASTAAERVFEILDTVPEIDDAPDAVDMADMKGAIEFKDVGFQYDAGEPVLKGISFKVEPGQMVGLVGSSGAGKTTVINLMARFYDATEGSITIDGIDIKKIKIETLRDKIAVVMQEPFLFHGTIAENIAYGNPKASMEEIIWAAKAANAHRFIINFPDGYDTRIGERGVGLSGGERQRLSIARAILKNPRILILDEATSSVDTETEKLIQEAIDRLISGRTTIAIAHRLSTLRNADFLLVLDDGKIAEVGTHEELLQREDGIFKHLWTLQSEVARMKAVI